MNVRTVIGRFGASSVAILAAGAAILGTVSHTAAIMIGGLLLGLGGALVIWPPGPEDPTILRRRAIRFANVLKNCTAEGRAQPRWQEVYPYGVTANMAEMLTASPRRPIRRRFTRRRWRKLRRLITELGVLGHIDMELRPWLTTRPPPVQIYDIARRLYRLAAVRVPPPG